MNIFTSLQSWCKILVLVKVQIILITFISSIAEAFNMSWFTKWFPDCLVFPVSLPYGVGQSGAKSGLFSVGQIPSTSSSIYFRSLLPNVPFRPHPCPAAISRGNISQDLAPTKYGISQVIAIMWPVPYVPEVFVFIQGMADHFHFYIFHFIKN